MAITKSESQVADQIVQSLAATYRISVERDWGEQPTDESSAAWKGGEWSLKEFHILQQAITDLAGAMGSPDVFMHNIGPLTISQVPMRYRGLASAHRLRFTTSSVSIDTWTVVHEMAHAWDAKFGWRLSKALETYTGGRTSRLAMLMRKWRGEWDEHRRLPGCNRFGYFYSGRPPAGSDQNFNRKEDFAESVTAYVYPTVALGRVAAYKDDERYREHLYYADYTQTRRWAFVNGLIKGTVKP